MKFTPTGLHGSFLVDVPPIEDERGLFARVFCKKEFEAIGQHKEFVQINHSRTNQRAAMCGVLVWAGILGSAVGVGTLLSFIVLGAVKYVGALVLIWFLSGRPQHGIERFSLDRLPTFGSGRS